MAILVTRPHPDNEATAARLRAKGFEVLLAPMLRLEPAAFHDNGKEPYGAIIVTSANALRAIESHLKASRLLKLPLFAVGEHTADVARSFGFEQVISASGDAKALRDCVLAAVKSKRLKKTNPLLYLAGADPARDLSAELGERGFTVATKTTYRMIPAPKLPRETCEAFTANGIEAVLHYSKRSARAFLDLARAAGVEISALSVPQFCISSEIATVVREAGATQVAAAVSPDENALLALLFSRF
jgi:uroporphyrinogen-III synthase